MSQHNFQVTALDAAVADRFFSMTAAELAAANARRMTVDKNPGFPCRVSLEDAEVGEEIVLFNYAHHEAASPYQATGPVFARKNARPAALARNELPAHLAHRHLSLRGYDQSATMLDARTVRGDGLAGELQSLFENEEVCYVHIHNAAQGCFHCRAERVG